jgi:hypothetical protein
MATTIAPIGYRERQQRGYAPSLWAYVSASVGGGGAMGVIVYFAGRWIPSVDETVAVLAVGMAGIGCAAADLQLIPRAFPESSWQVPSKWVNQLGGARVGAMFGVILSTGIAVRVPSASFYMVVMWAGLSGNIGLSVCAFAVYGLARSIPVLYWSMGDPTEYNEICQTSAWQPVAVTVAGLTTAIASGMCTASFTMSV